MIDRENGVNDFYHPIISYIQLQVLDEHLLLVLQLIVLYEM